MPVRDLPQQPSLEYLRNQAADLQRAHAAGQRDAVSLVAAYLPDRGERLSRTAAQFVLARSYGFPSWPGLKRHVELVTRYTRRPGEVPPSAEPATEFLRLACLTYADDDPERRREAGRILAAHPWIPRSSIHAAATVADPGQVRRFLHADRSAARTEGGPYRWEPLMYLAYARHEPAVPRERVLETARLLLAHGADPNAGYLWHGLTTPFTVLTGVFGAGELGSQRQPGHAHAPALARLLLQAGADPNDGQALYNRMFGTDDDHLELLFAFGLGTGSGGPWRARLGPALETPAQMLRRQLTWAVSHGMVARVRLLAEHGADLATPLEDGRTPAAYAAVNGHRDIAAYLRSRVPDQPEPTGVDALIGAVLAGDRAAVARLRAADPALVDAARAQRPGLMVWAAAARRHQAVALLAELGFDVNAMARGDLPREQPWQTALHEAVARDDAALVRQLLALGADPTVRDRRFDATPLGWARHFDREELIALLAPLTDE